MLDIDFSSFFFYSLTFLLIFFLPLFLGLIILIRSWSDDFSRYVGFMCLKPVVILSAIILLDDLYPPPPFGNVLFTILELIPTLIIVYSFKHVFIDNRAAWIFLAGDIILWLGFIISGSFPEPYVDIAGYFFLYLYPLLYAVIGFAIVRKRTINRNAIHY